MEASFCGPKQTASPILESDGITVITEEDLNYHYTAEDLMQAGKKLCETITLYNNINIDISKQIEEIKSYHTKKQKEDVPLSAMLSGQKGIQERNSSQTYNTKGDANRRISVPTKKQDKTTIPQ